MAVIGEEESRHFVWAIHDSQEQEVMIAFTVLADLDPFGCGSFWSSAISTFHSWHPPFVSYFQTKPPNRDHWIFTLRLYLASNGHFLCLIQLHD